MKKFFAWGFGFIVVLFFIIPSGGDEKTNDNNKKSDSSIAEKKEAQDKQVADLNKWFKSEDRIKEISEQYAKDGKEFIGTDSYLETSVIKEFKNVNGNLIVVISHNRLKSEGFKQDDIATAGFVDVTMHYPGKLDTLNNITNYWEDIGAYSELA